MTSPSYLGQAGLSRELLEELAQLWTDEDRMLLAMAVSDFYQPGFRKLIGSLPALLAAALRDADVRELDEWAEHHQENVPAPRCDGADGWSVTLTVNGKLFSGYRNSGPTPALARRAAAEAIGGGK